MDVTLPRETNEFLPIPVMKDDVARLDFEVALTRWPAHPTEWTAAVQVGDEAGVVAAGLEPGTWQVWVRVDGTVIAAGSIWVK